MTEKEKSYLSATALAKKYGISIKEMFIHLANSNLIEKRGDVWSLTNEGIEAGGKFITGKQFGKYIVWPEGLDLNISSGRLITIQAIARHFSLEKEELIEILSRIKWLYSAPSGLLLMSKGRDAGGMEDREPKTDALVLRWPESVVENPELCHAVEHRGGEVTEKDEHDILGLESSETVAEDENREPEALLGQNGEKLRPEKDENRELVAEKQTAVDSVMEEHAEGKVEEVNPQACIIKEQCAAEYRCADGHYVFTRPEAVLDNWLYHRRIIHAYAAACETTESSSFHLPERGLYLKVIIGEPTTSSNSGNILVINEDDLSGKTKKLEDLLGGPEPDPCVS